MKYVTFYYNMIFNSIHDLKVHDNEETALKYFNSNYKNYFTLKTPFKATKLPAEYGFPARKYYGVSARKFKEMFNISVDEAMNMQWILLGDNKNE